MHGAARRVTRPRRGRRKVHEITADAVAELTRELQAEGLADWTIRGVLTPLSVVLGYAARRGYVTENVAKRLERDERPRVARREQRILEDGEIQALLAKAPAKYELLLRTAAFTGLRLGEILGLTWADVDLANGFLQVRKRLTQAGERTEPKTPQAVRSVVVDDVLAKRLAQHWQESRFQGDENYVFATETGSPMYYRNVERRGLEKAAENAGLAVAHKPKLRFHDLRHTFASMAIRDGADVVFLSRQLGHGNPSITLAIYSHLFDAERQAKAHRARMSARHGGKVAETTAGNGRETTGEVETELASIAGGNDSAEFPSAL